MEVPPNIEGEPIVSPFSRFLLQSSNSLLLMMISISGFFPVVGKIVANKLCMISSSNAGQAILRRILVAEDNKATRDVVSSFLEFLGFEVAFACNGIEALAVFIERSFDLVLTDLEMPAMDGWGLTRCIKQRSPKTPVVLMTGADRETVRKKVEREPVDSVIFKPFALEDLQSAVQGALSSKEREHGNEGMRGVLI